MKRFIVLILSLFLVSYAFAGGKQEAQKTTPKVETDKPIVLKLTHEGPLGDQRQKAAETFARIVKEKTGSKAIVEVYPAASLGPKEQVHLGMETGVVDSLIEDVGTLQRYNNICALGFMPFIYRGEEHFIKVWKSSFKDEFFNEVEKKTGFKNLGVMYRGGRQITAIKPVRKLEDLKGLKIRVPTSEVMVNTFKALGASPVPMNFPEVFGALQQKVIDAQENPLDTINSNSIQEVAPYITLSNHVIGAFNFQFWGKTFAKYPDWLQKVIVEAAEFASDEYTADTSKKEQQILEKFKSNPKIEIIRLDDKELARWQQAAATVYDSYPDLKPYIKRILEVKK
jgi:tripartite ATP-independent transporter DctP family solute receptor